MTDKERMRQMYARAKWHPLVWFQLGVCTTLVIIVFLEWLLRHNLWGKPF